MKLQRCELNEESRRDIADRILAIDRFSQVVFSWLPRRKPHLFSTYFSSLFWMSYWITATLSFNSFSKARKRDSIWRFQECMIKRLNDKNMSPDNELEKITCTCQASLYTKQNLCTLINLDKQTTVRGSQLQFIFADFCHSCISIIDFSFTVIWLKSHFGATFERN